MYEAKHLKKISHDHEHMICMN